MTWWSYSIYQHELMQEDKVYEVIKTYLKKHNLDNCEIMMRVGVHGPLFGYRIVLDFGGYTIEDLGMVVE